MANVKQLAQNLAIEVKEKVRKASLEKIKSEFYNWLAELKFPNNPDTNSWNEIVLEYDPVPIKDEPDKGIVVRFALRLYTTENQYLISIMESLSSLDAGNFVLTVHVNWQSEELRKRKNLEETYGSQFDEMLKAKHTIWAQTFREGKLTEALNAGAVAILGHELKPNAPKEQIGELIQPVSTQVPSFPKPSED